MKLAQARGAWSVVSPVLLALSLPARAGVLVVGPPGPGTDFPTIQAAVDAALEGDTILVEDGIYAPFTIAGKSLDVVADGTGVEVRGISVQIRDVGQGQAVLVRGIRTNFGISIVACAGPVWLEDLRVVATATICNEFSVAGAYVAGSSRATFTRCLLVGSSDAGGFSPPNTAEGLYALASSVHLFDCEILGGPGSSQGWYAAQPGAAGMRIDSSTVTIVGCTIRGGGGGRTSSGFGGSLCTVTHPAGGAGVLFAGAAGVVRSAESTAAGGATSLEPFCPGQTGPQGPAISGSGTIVALPGFARHLRANGPVRGGQTLTFEVGGQAGELPLLLVSPVHHPVPLLNGMLLVGLPPTDLFLLAPLSASGAGSLSFAVPNLGALVESITLYAQAVFLDPSSTLWLGAGTSVVLLDPTF